MWFLSAPAAVTGLVAIALLPTASAKPYPVPVEELSEEQNATQIDKRQACAGVVCGFIGICCEGGLQCSTNTLNQATCVGAATANQQQGSWQFSTTVYTATDLVTRTSVFSTLVTQPTGVCAASQSCGSICCQSNEYCFKRDPAECRPIAGATPGVTGIVNPSAPLRPTSSTLIIITATGSPTATLPFSTPIPTGANGTLLESNQGGGGLSGGAIAGIVIGVILGIILLLLICFYCCAKAAFDTILACFGLGKKKRRTHESSTYIEEHHHHGGSAAAGGRRWYGQAGSSRPSRPPKKTGGGMGNLLGIGAGLAGLAAVMGMKRKHDRRHDDKSTTVTDSSYYYSDYTSSSSASSDRRTRNTRHSRR